MEEMKNKVEREERLVFVGTRKCYLHEKPVLDGLVEGWRALCLIGNDQLYVKPCSKRQLKKYS